MLLLIMMIDYCYWPAQKYLFGAICLWPVKQKTTDINDDCHMITGQSALVQSLIVRVNLVALYLFMSFC